MTSPTETMCEATFTGATGIVWVCNRPQHGPKTNEAYERRSDLDIKGPMGVRISPESENHYFVPRKKQPLE